MHPVGQSAPLSGASPPSAVPASRGRAPLRAAAAAVAAVAAFLVAYFALGSALSHRIDDDPDFAPSAPVAGGSRAIDMAAALIEREVVLHSWQPNDPWFLPNGLLDNTPNFQAGIKDALARFAFELVDQLGRTRGSSRADPDLERAGGLLQFPSGIWYFDFRKSLLPVIPSEGQFRAAREALLAYNGRLARNAAVYDRRTDSLAAAIDRIAVDLGSQSGLIDQHLRTESGGWPLNPEADDLFYHTKGRLYAYFLLLREVGHDFEPVIQAGNLGQVWEQAMASLREGSLLQPWVVLDGSPEAGLFASHIASQGFFLKRALVQLREMSDGLVN
jgi:hypothetical protein